MGPNDIEFRLPRLFLIGAFAVVALVVSGLTGFYSWQNWRDQSVALEGVDAAIASQQKARLTSEMTSALAYLDYTRAQTEERLRKSLKEQVDVAYQLMEAIHQRESPRLPEPAVRALVMEALRPLRFYDGRGYYFLDDMAGNFVLLPTAPAFEGRNGIDNRDDSGHFIMRGLIETARQNREGGYSRYRWYRPDNPKVMSDKLAYVRYFAPYDWLVGTGDYMYEWENLQQREAMARLRALKFGDSGRVGLLDAEGKSLLSPSHPEVEGKPLKDMPERERDTLQRIRDLAHQGGGFVTYDWKDPVGGEWVSKTALVQMYAPWNWVVVVTMFDRDLRQAVQEQRALQLAGSAQRRNEILLSLVAACSLGLLAAWLFARWLKGYLLLRRKEREQAEADLRVAAIAFEAQEGMFVTDAQHTILRVNRAFVRITGFDPADVIGHKPSVLSSGRHDGDFYAAMHAALAEKGVWEGEIWNRRKSGEVHPEWLTITAVRHADGQVSSYVCTLVDITERKAAEEEIRNLAFYDALTKLPNRRLLMDRLHQAMLSLQRSRHTGALMFIDLDNFKLVNDSLGHDKGDLLLIQVAGRIAGCLRQQDTVARQGGDEFVVLLENLNPDLEVAAADARAVAQKVLDAIAQPYDLSGQAVDGSCSVGIALFSAGHDVKPEDVMKQADMAMYRSKSEGRNTLRFFDPRMQAAVTDRIQLVKDMRQGLSGNQFHLVFQTQQTLDGRLVGMEALLRWKHPTKGFISPAQFIPLAEENGFILTLGDWVLETACQRLAWLAAQPDRLQVPIAVNVSGLQLRQDDFVARVMNLVQRCAAPAHLLKLELTESLLLDNTEDTIAKMAALKAHGVGFALDDFGTGYSSLAYLKRLPLDQLKIDKSFVDDLTHDDKAVAIVRTVVALADSLGMDVIAEGVETESQRDALARHGCKRYQGYLYGAPVKWEELPV